MRIINRMKWLLVATSMCVTGWAHAGLIGTELTVQVIFQETATSPVTELGFATQFTVTDPGIEIPDLSATQLENNVNLDIPPVSIDVGDDFFEFRALGVGGTLEDAFFNGLAFTFDSDVGVTFISAIIDAVATSTVFDVSRVTFTDNSILVNVAGLSGSGSDVLRVNLEAVSNDELDPPPTNSVPEPGSLGILGLGLLSLGLMRRVAKV